MPLFCYSPTSNARGLPFEGVKIRAASQSQFRCDETNFHLIPLTEIDVQTTLTIKFIQAGNDEIIKKNDFFDCCLWYHNRFRSGF